MSRAYCLLTHSFNFQTADLANQRTPGLLSRQASVIACILCGAEYSVVL
jgi:hypothetical protein